MLSYFADTITLFCRLNFHVKKDFPIRSSEMGLLIHIVRSDVPVTSSAAADYLKVTKPMIATMVASLSKKGYLNKLHSQDDKRSFVLSPTDKAFELTNRAFSEHIKILELLRSRLGNRDFELLITMLDKANDVLSE